MRDSLTKTIFNTDDEKIIKFRLMLLDYLDETLYKKNEYMFYNLLGHTRFINSPKHIAYTTREKIIHLAQPNNSLKDTYKNWEFVYAHECLHVIYDTFEVGDLIEKELGKCDHELLNIAADCIINETLLLKYKKQSPPIGIFAQNIKDIYNVEYDMSKDTQYTLYLKILEAKENNPNIDDSDFSEIYDKLHKDDVSNDSQESQQTSSDQDTNDSKASERNGEMVDSDSNINNDNEKDEEQQKIDDFFKNNSDFGGFAELSDYYTHEPNKSIKDIINDANNTLSGALGDFLTKVRKIPNQIKQTKRGINVLVNDNKGNTRYMDLLNAKVNVLLNNKLKRSYNQIKRTYGRVNRRNPFPGEDGIIKKGKKWEADKINIDLSFYVDISGSMSMPYNKVDPIFRDLYNNDDILTKKYTRLYKEILNELSFTYYAFNDKFHIVKDRAIPRPTGGNVNLHELLDRVLSEVDDESLLKVIITDAGFDVNNEELIKLIPKLKESYLIILVDNEKNWEDWNKIEKQSHGRIIGMYTESF